MNHLPEDLLPETANAKIDLVLWGLRDMRFSCKAVRLIFSIAGSTCSTTLQPIVSTKKKRQNWINFTPENMGHTLRLSLPRNKKFAPSFQITIENEKGKTLASYNHG